VAPVWRGVARRGGGTAISELDRLGPDSRRVAAGRDTVERRGGRPEWRCHAERMVYVLLASAIVAEVLGTTALKFSDGFTRLWPSTVTVVMYVISFVLLAQTLKTMAVGTAYAIWSAVGTALIAAIGMVFLGEAATWTRMLGIALVIAGVVILNLAENPVAS
jgi:small multidrug resistance pump